MTNRSRILIADDHNLVELCKRLLESEFDVVGIVATVAPWWAPLVN